MSKILSNLFYSVRPLFIQKCCLLNTDFFLFNTVDNCNATQQTFVVKDLVVYGF